MNAIATSIPAPAQRRPARIAAAAAALVMALAGAVALAGTVLRDGDGYFNTPSETFTSTGYAVAMKSVDVSDAPKWVFGNAGLDSIRVKADGDRPLFIGIAHAADIDRYLRGTEHDDVSGLSYHPFHVGYDHRDGDAPGRAPAAASLWVKSSSGTGSLSLAWKPRPGNWRAVLMNADGSRGVTATLQFGARTSLLEWVGAGLIGAAVLAAALAAALSRRARA
jgi:hypothetical protein